MTEATETRTIRLIEASNSTRNLENEGQFSDSPYETVDEEIMAPTHKFPERTLEVVREYVRDELSVQNRLERDAFPMAERIVTRKGSPVGFYFCMYGPRSVRLTAVWDLQKEEIFFYDSLGRRSNSQPAPVNH